MLMTCQKRVTNENLHIKTMLHLHNLTCCSISAAGMNLGYTSDIAAAAAGVNLGYTSDIAAAAAAVSGKQKCFWSTAVSYAKSNIFDEKQLRNYLKQ